MNIETYCIFWGIVSIIIIVVVIFVCSIALKLLREIRDAIRKRP